MKDWFGLTVEFSCAHFYRQAKWDEKKNREVFGKCFTPYGHGHDYVLKAEFLQEELAPEQAREALRKLREELDHQHLNFVFEEFHEKVPTTENLILFCRDRLRRNIGRPTTIHLTLWERRDLGASLSS
jgi:6-pyruvoyltetrahydropterin/6-carboxytetrahydropterin synthase